MHGVAQANKGWTLECTWPCTMAEAQEKLAPGRGGTMLSAEC